MVWSHSLTQIIYLLHLRASEPAGRLLPYTIMLQHYQINTQMELYFKWFESLKSNTHLYHDYNLFKMLTVVRIFKSIYVHLVKIILCSIKLHFIVTCPYNMSAATKPPITSL